MVQLKKSAGFHKPAKRLGRGNGSGKGNYSTRGLKGQGARSGSKIPAWFEGGQTPLTMKLPKKKGFKRPDFMKTTYQIVNVDAIENAQITTINKEALKTAGLIKSLEKPVKILAKGDVSTKLVFTGIESFSQTAREKIGAAGGSIN